MKQMVMSPFEKLKSMKKSIFNKGPANNWIGAVATLKTNTGGGKTIDSGTDVGKNGGNQS